MTEPRTLSLLYDAIEEEYAWRITELSNFRNSVLSAAGRAQKGMIRAGIALLYAHWEGFIKKTADLYYSFVSYQNCTIAELSDCFVSIALRSEIEYLQTAKKLSVHNTVVKSFFEREHKQANLSASSPIRTANLKYDIFEDVCIMIGVSIDYFHDRYRRGGFDTDIKQVIDDGLVKRRNSIAHGDYLDVDEKEYKYLYDIIVNGLLYNFKEAIYISAQNKSYRRI